MPADGIAAAAQKEGLRHVLLAARGLTQCPSIQHTTLVRLSEGPRSGVHTGRRGNAPGARGPKKGAAGAGRVDCVQIVADDLSGSAASCCARYTIVEY